MGHEELLAEALKTALADVSLEDLTEDLDEEPLVDADGDHVEIETVDTLADAGFMTSDKGVVVRLTDGSEFTVSITAYRPPRDGWRE
jgi:hypothetical protein